MPGRCSPALVLMAPVWGHAFPAQFHFQGGKGIAVTFGCLLGLCLATDTPLKALAFFFLFFSLVLRVSPNFYRTGITYLCALAVSFYPPATGVRLEFLGLTARRLLRLHLSPEKREKLRILPLAGRTLPWADHRRRRRHTPRSRHLHHQRGAWDGLTRAPVLRNFPQLLKTARAPPYRRKTLSPAFPAMSMPIAPWSALQRFSPSSLPAGVRAAGLCAGPGPGAAIFGPVIEGYGKRDGPGGARRGYRLGPAWPPCGIPGQCSKESSTAMRFSARVPVPGDLRAVCCPEW